MAERLVLSHGIKEDLLTNLEALYFSGLTQCNGQSVDQGQHTSLLYDSVML